MKDFRFLEKSSDRSTLKNLYDTDFWLWIQQTAQQLKAKDFDTVDWDNLIEEIEALGRSEKKALLNNAKIVLLRLLKWKYQSDKRSNSWLSSINEHRERLEVDFQESPSLKRFYNENFEALYQRARRRAAIETRLALKSFPEQSPFTPEQVLDLDFLPH
ncbi:MAG: DUF29 domain-containing protein [Cyanophyceae cyanobacterium]